MASVAAEPFKGLPPKKVDGRRFKVGIVYARWNLKITTALVEGARYGDGELLHLAQGALRLTPQLQLAGRRYPSGILAGRRCSRRARCRRTLPFTRCRARSSCLLRRAESSPVRS